MLYISIHCVCQALNDALFLQWLGCAKVRRAISSKNICFRLRWVSQNKMNFFKQNDISTYFS